MSTADLLYDGFSFLTSLRNFKRYNPLLLKVATSGCDVRWLNRKIKDRSFVMSNQSKPWEHAKSSGSAEDPLAVRFVQSLTYDRRLYKHDIAGSIAHAQMLHDVGLISADDLTSIQNGLQDIQTEIQGAGDDYGAAWPGWKPHLEDVHMCIEAALIEKTGDPGRKLHTGRSRNDQVALDLVLWANESLACLDHAITGLLRAFVTLAERDGSIVMPSYTHLQRAQPIVVGGELMAWISAMDRARRRLMTVRELNGDNPLGSGAIAGTALPIDRGATSELLGIGPPTSSSMDGTASRDIAIDFVYGLSMVAMTLSRWAEQWIIYASVEFGFIRLGEAHTTGSSMMPQKANPDMLELIRGRSGTVYGHLVALMTMSKGITIGYNRDLQEDKRHVFAAYDVTIDCIEMADRIVKEAEFCKCSIHRDIQDGYLDATSLAEYFVTKGVPFRTAHQIVGTLVQATQKRSLGRLDRLVLADFKQACQEFGIIDSICKEDVYEWLGPENVAKRYRSAGNAGVAGFEQQLGYWQRQLADES